MVSVGSRLKIQSVEHIALIAAIVKDPEFRPVQKPAGVHAVQRDEIADALRSVSQLESAARRPERSIGCRYRAVRLIHSEARARGHYNHQTGLIAIFGGRRALDHFHRLHRIHRQLVREDFALLIGNRLSIHRERIRSVIAQSMEQSVGIGGDAGRGQGHERAERGRLAFQRQLFEETAVDIGVRHRIDLDQVSRAGLDSHGSGRRPELQRDLGFDRDRRADVDILFSRGKARCGDGEVVVVKGNVVELKPAFATCFCSLTVMRHRIFNRDCGAGDCGAGRVGHRATNRTGRSAAARLRSLRQPILSRNRTKDKICQTNRCKFHNHQACEVWRV